MIPRTHVYIRAAGVLLAAAILVCTVASAFAQTPTGGAAPTISPSAISTTLAPGECHDDTVALAAPEAPVPSLDVALVMDITGSMGDEIDQVRKEATALVQRIQRLVPDSRFAVATFADYEYVQYSGDLFDIFGNAVEFGDPGDYPWQLDQQFTADAGEVQAAVNRIVLLNGGDTPEPYLRALDEAAALAWRPAARRIVVLFGDSYPHEPDPGRDAALDTADDLEQDTVLRRLQERGVSVFAVQSVGGEVSDFYQSLADETGGKSYGLSDASEAANAIGDLLEQDVAQLRQLTLRPSVGYSNWVTWRPEQYAALGGGEQASFAVQICRPESAQSGDQTFDLNVIAAGATIGAVPITVLMPFQWWLWAPWLLAPLLLGLAVFWWLRRPRPKQRTRPGQPRRGVPPSGSRTPGTIGGGPPPSDGNSGKTVTHGRDSARK